MYLKIMLIVTSGMSKADILDLTVDDFLNSLIIFSLPLLSAKVSHRPCNNGR